MASTGSLPIAGPNWWPTARRYIRPGATRASGSDSGSGWEAQCSLAGVLLLDTGFAVTPAQEQTAEMLNAGLVEGMTPFVAGQRNDILGRAFPMFDLVEGQIVSDYDLIYFHSGLLFMGAKHVDGTPFDRLDRRPHQLQIPLARVPDHGRGPGAG